MKKIYILTGNVNSGKTTKLREWINQYRTSCSFNGILSPIVDGKRIFEDIASGRMIPFEENGGLIRTGKYFFSESAFMEAKNLIRQIYTCKKNWLIIDEFGNLEMNDYGFNPVISDLIKSEEDFNLLLVIRNSLLSAFLKKYSLLPNQYRMFSFQNPAVPVWILAGGKSNRMGQEKALLTFGSESLIEIIIKKIARYFTDINLITNQAEKFDLTFIDIYEDILKGYGPLSGIHSALTNSSKDTNLLFSCDMPLVSDELLQFFSKYNSGYSVLFKSEGFINPFPGLYSKEILPLINSHLASVAGRTKSIISILNSFDGIRIENAEDYGFDAENFFNMNSPADYQYALDRMRNS